MPALMKQARKEAGMRYLIGMIMGGFGGWLGGYWLVMSRLEGQSGLALLIGTQAAPTAPDTILCMGAGAALGIGLAALFQPHPPPGGEVLRPKAGADTYRYPAVLRPKAGADTYRYPAVLRPKAGADIGARDEAGVAAALMKAGITPLGATPLHRSARNYLDPMLAVALVKAGADIGARDQAGNTPLHYAARHNPNPAVIAALIEAGADIDARNKDGKLPFDLASDNKALWGTEVYKQLARAGPVRPDAADRD